MATKKITDLVELTSASSGDVLPIVDISEDITKKITASNLLATKQDTLVSGTNIKTLNSESLLGSGNIDVSSNWGDIGGTLSNQTDLQNALNAKQETLVSGTNIKTINSTSLLGSGDITIQANPSGGAGAIQFSDGSAFASDSNLFWDNTNKRLAVGTITPSATCHIKGSGSTSATTSLLVQNSSGNNALTIKDDLSAIFGSGLTTNKDLLFQRSDGLEVMTYANAPHVLDFGAGLGRVRFQGEKVSIGGLPNASAALTIQSTTRGFLPPVMTTTQKNAISSPAAGLQVYDTTLNQMSYYNGTSWVNF